MMPKCVSVSVVQLYRIKQLSGNISLNMFVLIKNTFRELTAEVLSSNWDRINFLNKYNVRYITEFYQVKIQLVYIPNLCKEDKRNE